MKTPLLSCFRFLTLLSIVCALGCSRQGAQLEDIEGIRSLKVKHSPPTAFSELAWSPDGRYVAARAYVGRNNSAVTVIDLQTGETRRLYESRGDYLLGPKWSPDGQSLVFYTPRSQANPRSGGLVIVDAETGGIIRDFGFGVRATWTTDSEHIIMVEFSSSCEKTVSIDDYNLVTDSNRTIGTTGSCSPETTNSLDVSVDGKLVVPGIDGVYSQILDIADGTSLGTLNPTGGSTVWSPDGTMLAFITKKMVSSTPTDSIILASADGSCLSEPLELNSYLYSVDWSPDGSRLVFSNRDVNRLYFLDLATGVGKELMDSYRERCTG
ncbi:MAG TPA: hypothetical protein PKJ56_03535 [Promineifilum sp.]|nr:hypothetical protein [Promineifilum sp.]